MFDATPFLRVYAKRRHRQLATQDPVRTQSEQLLALVTKARDTKFGRAHGFTHIRSVTDFQERVPLRTYEALWNEYWRHDFPTLRDCTWPGTIPYFALSSGTSSGTTKYIPCSKEMLRSNTKAGLDLLTHHLINRPQSKIFGGKSFLLGGSTDLTEYAPGVWGGDLSGIAAKTMPLWTRGRYFPPQHLTFLKDWEEKIAKFATLAPTEDIRMISGVPSWMLILFERVLQQHRADSLATPFPRLEMIVHGGVNFAPYRERFRALLGASGAELREVYPASEGFLAIADGAYAEGLRLNIDHGIFYEFVPVEELAESRPARHWLATIETGVNYAVVMSTCAGAWGYVLGDTIKFLSRTPPRLLVTGRTSYTLSAFGEHLIGEEIEKGVVAASAAVGRTVREFSVGPLYPSGPGILGGHLYIIEFEGAPMYPQEVEKFGQVIDHTLCELNEDYAAHRADGFGLNPPRIISAAPGTFTQWMKRRGKLGGQHKVPRIINDVELLRDLEEFVTETPHALVS